MVNNKKVLILGCGSIGKRHARALNCLGVNNISFCDMDKSKLEEISKEIKPTAVYLSYDEALNQKFDAVFICTPPALHVNQALKAIRSDCDVFIEKPLSTKLDGINVLEAEMINLKKLIMVGLCFRFHEGLKRVKDLIESREVGRLLSVRASIGEYLADCRPGVDYRKLYVVDKDVGVTLDLCHEPDFVQWIIGSLPSKITAYTGKISDLEMQGDDIAEMIITFTNNVVASIHLDFFQRVRRRNSEFICTNGTILLDMADWNICYIKIYKSSSGKWTNIEIPMQRDDMFKAMDKEFLECIDNRTEPSVGLTDGIKLLSLILSAKESSKNGKTVIINNYTL